LNPTAAVGIWFYQMQNPRYALQGINFFFNLSARKTGTFGPYLSKQVVLLPIVYKTAVK